MPTNPEGLRSTDAIMETFTTRFAPSPTGYLHMGHAYSARCAFDAAKKANGTCLLRIEDTDQTRCTLDFEQAIEEDLSWLGFQWPTPVRRQSDHLTEYTEVLEKLQDKGLVYRCFKTRREVLDEIALAPHDSATGTMHRESIYTGTPLPPSEERTALDNGKPYAWRLSMTACKDYLGAAWQQLNFQEEGTGPNNESGHIKATPEIFGDVILARKDTGTSYHLACVHDDGMQGITHIIRGMDLFTVTHLHVLLQYLLNIPTPTYRHHPLLLDQEGKRFAKRDKARTLRSIRAAGNTADDVMQMIDKHLQHQNL